MAQPAERIAQTGEMMIRISRIAVQWIAAGVLLATLASTAAAQNANLAPGFKSLAEGAKVALMPIDVELFNISAGGVVEPQAEWTNTALGFMREGFKATRDQAKVHFVDVDDKGEESIDELNRLHGAVGKAIAFHHFGIFSLPTKDKKLEWTLGPEVKSIRDRTGADYALFVFLHDSYASAERKAAIVVAAIFGVGLGGGVQNGYASLVDLRSGDIVWFNRLIRGTGDLREREPAMESVRSLLAGFPG